MKQRKKKQTAAKADRLIGAGLPGKSVNGVAVRSLRAPGTAWDHERFGGKDPQPGPMSDYVELPNTEPGDYGGVCINPGIRTTPFIFTAIQLGGDARDRAGRICYEALRNRMRANSTFKTAAKAMLASSASLFGSNNPEQKAVKPDGRKQEYSDALE